MKYTDRKFRAQFRDRILQLIDLRRMSKAEVLKKSEVSRAAFYKMLQKKKNTLPSIDTLEKVLKVLQIEAHIFMNFTISLQSFGSSKQIKQLEESSPLRQIVALQIKWYLYKISRETDKPQDYFFSKDHKGDTIGKEEYSKYVQKIYNYNESYKNLRLETVYYISECLDIPIHLLFEKGAT